MIDVKSMAERWTERSPVYFFVPGALGSWDDWWTYDGISGMWCDMWSSKLAFFTSLLSPFHNTKANVGNLLGDFANEPHVVVSFPHCIAGRHRRPSVVFFLSKNKGKEKCLDAWWWWWWGRLGPFSLRQHFSFLSAGYHHSHSVLVVDCEKCWEAKGLLSPFSGLPSRVKIINRCSSVVSRGQIRWDAHRRKKDGMMCHVCTVYFPWLKSKQPLRT